MLMVYKMNQAVKEPAIGYPSIEHVWAGIIGWLWDFLSGEDRSWLDFYP